MGEYLKDNYLNSVLESYFIDIVNEAEGIGGREAIINRFNNAKEINVKQNLLGKLLTAKANAKNAEEVERLMSQYNLSHTYNTKQGKLVYTSPDMKFKGMDVKFVSSASIQCRDGYASLKNIYTLKNFIWLYNFLSENKDEKLNQFIESGCKYLYEDRNVTIDKNYRYIAENWLKIKNFYIYTVYGNSTDMYCDIEVDISKFKGLQDYVPKKSCVVIYVRYNFNYGKLYVGSEIMNDRTTLFELTDPEDE